MRRTPSFSQLQNISSGDRLYLPPLINQTPLTQTTKGEHKKKEIRHII